MIYLDILNKTGVYPYFFVCQCEICRYVFFLIFLFGFKQLQHIFYLNMISVCKYSVSFDIWDAPFGLYVYMSTYHGYLEVLPYIFYFIL